MNRVAHRRSHPDPRTSASGRPAWGWSLLLLSALLLSPAAATAVMHAWAQESAAVPERAALSATPRRSPDDAIPAIHDDAPEESPQSHPAPEAPSAPAPQPPRSVWVAAPSPLPAPEAPAPARGNLPRVRTPRAPPA